MSARGGSKGLVLAGEPSVQLLPPSVRERAKNREFRRLMVLLMVLAVVVVGGGSAFAFTRAVAAELALTDAQAETASLLAQQQQYAEASRVAELVDATREAQQLLTVGEADWAAIYAEILGRLSEGTSVDSGVITSLAPWEALPAQPGTAVASLGGGTVVTLSITVTSEDVLTASHIATRLHTMTGYRGSAITGSVFEKMYLTNIVIALDRDALANRFAPEPEEEPAKPEKTEGADS